MVLLLIVIGCVLGVVASCRQRSRNRQVANDPAEPAVRSERADPEVTREAYIASHKKEYPQSLRDLLERNPETVDFVYDYPKEGKKQHEIDLSGEVTQGTIPLFLQWDERWGYQEYGSDMLAITGCGPTCLSMVYVYFTHDLNGTPREIASYCEKNGYYTENGTSWSLWTEGLPALGLSGKELPLGENSMKTALDQGKLIVCSMRPGDFTTSGHYILLYDYDDTGFCVKDPNRVSNSSRTWDYDTLSPQIKNLWTISPTGF